LAIARCLAMPECQQGGGRYRPLHLNRCTRLPSEKALFRQQATHLVRKKKRQSRKNQPLGARSADTVVLRYRPQPIAPRCCIVTYSSRPKARTAF